MATASSKKKYEPDCEAQNPCTSREEGRVSSTQRESRWDEDDEDYDEKQSYGEMIGKGCAWCLINHTDIPLFFLSFIILYLSINRCCYCVVVVASVSALLCMRFPLLNATLWSALIVLYLHKDWNLNFGNVRVSWNRSN